MGLGESEARTVLFTPAGCCFSRSIYPLAAGCFGLCAVDFLHFKMDLNHLAGAEGIEPPTFGFGDRRSAN